MAEQQTAEIDARCCDEGMTCLECDPDATFADIYATDPRDSLAMAGGGSAAYLTPDGTDVEPLTDYLTRVTPPGVTPPATPHADEGGRA